MSRVPAARRTGAFTRGERAWIASMPAVERCDETRITWNTGFARRVAERVAAGESPTTVFREAVLGPEIIGHKRIERCAARWRARYTSSKETR